MDFTFICYFTISTFVVAIVVVDVNGDDAVAVARFTPL